MKRILLASLLFIAGVTVSAQFPLSGSRQSGTHTYIYKISFREAKAFSVKGLGRTPENYLHTLIDSFLTDLSEEPELPKGNYLYVQAVQNRLEMKMKTVDSLHYLVFNDNNRIGMIFQDGEGKTITDLKVFANGKPVSFNATNRVFEWPDTRKKLEITADHEGVFHRFERNSVKNNRYYASFWQRLKYQSPLRHILLPIDRLFRRQRPYYNFFDRPVPYEKGYRGFMVFNQPRYKPGDTVHLKAFVQTDRTRPVDRPLIVRLSSQGIDVDTILATIHPYTPGGYTYDFVLNTDSLDLDLDDRYLITLEEPRSRKFNVDEYPGDLEEEEIMGKRQVLMRGYFEFEDYELSYINFTAKENQSSHHKGNPVTITYNAVDENNLPVLDAIVKVVITSNENQSASFQGDYVFVPDTLWTHELKLKADGETTLTIPDSIFPRAGIQYSIENRMTTGDYRNETVTLSLHYDPTPYSIVCTQQEDSLTIEQHKGDRAVEGRAEIAQLNDKQILLRRSVVILPATISIHPLASLLVIKTDSVEQRYPVKDLSGMDCLSFRNLDSVKIQVINPSGQYFWYTLFAGKKPVKKGYARSFDYRERLVTRRNYFLKLQYISRGAMLSRDFYITNREKLLDIAVKGPDYVYPGQTVHMELSLTDINGRPIADADVTSYGVTTRFESKAPFVPYLGKDYPGLKRKYTPAASNLVPYQPSPLQSRLNWKRWSLEMGLDSIEYYRFLRPDLFYVQQEPAPDSLTQVAPFLVLDGEILPVVQLFIDEVPVYFNQSENIRRYSFPITSGKHSFRFRTDTLMITLDSIQIRKGMKNFFSVNVDTAINRQVKVKRMPDTLTAYEKIYWEKYMLLIENNFAPHFTYIKSADGIFLLLPQKTNPVSLVGPFYRYNAQLVVKDKFKQYFEPEGNYQFEIREGLIKQKQLPIGRYGFDKHLGAAKGWLDFKDYILTEKEVDSLWNNYLDHHPAISAAIFTSALGRKGNGRLKIDIRLDSTIRDQYIKNLFLFRADDADYLRVYAGGSRDLGYLRSGSYRLLVLLTGSRYALFENIPVSVNGINYQRLRVQTLNAKDSISEKINSIVNRYTGKSYIDEAGSDQIKANYNQAYLPETGFTHFITGRVMDAKSGDPIQGASVFVKGTRKGVATKNDGSFSLYCPINGTLVVAYVGYNTHEARFTASMSDMEIKLKAAESRLDEVVVTGFGVRSKKELTASVSSVNSNVLLGKVSGINITIRGAATIKNQSAPLILLNGLPFSGDINKLDSSKISITLVKDPKILSLYGNPPDGLILINTEPVVPSGDMQEMAGDEDQSVTLRTNFRDYSYWQPRLRTNQEGKAKFTVTYPDDITNWKNYFIAIKGKYTGFLEKPVKSFKTISAQLSLPMFVTEGDSLNLLGKSLHYGNDSIVVSRKMSVGNMVLLQRTGILSHSLADSIITVVDGQDSLRVQYELQKNDGYTDGERRAIPIIRQGVKETNGFFTVLEGDTVIRFHSDSLLGPLTVYAESNLLPVWETEIEHIRDYEYLCNEQMASKLKALLMKKKIFQYQKRKFEEERNINILIADLGRNQNVQGQWGWWSQSNSVWWISLHVAEALLMAEEMGYKTTLNRQFLIDQGVAEMGGRYHRDFVTWLRLLYRLGAKVNYNRYLDTINAHKASDYTDTLDRALLNTQLGRKQDLTVVWNKQHQTVFGNSYWGETQYQLQSGITEQTLLVYQLLKQSGGYEKELKKIQYYFLEQRKSGYWANTYESCRILETILPDLLTDRDTIPAILQWKDGTRVTAFPYKATLKQGESFEISKAGGGPVFFTAFQQYWNPKPARVEGNFIVTTRFTGNQSINNQLKAGEPVTMNVEVVVKADADYVMIEIPIPAACSYTDKVQSWRNNEVHREYFRNKVSIFCSKLTAGNYQFTVNLLPRFSGKYFLNPAKVEMMYYPVFFGREGMRKMEVK